MPQGPTPITDPPLPAAQAPEPDPHGVIIAGAGVAGIAAAVRLAEAGRGVTLLETRRKLGGRATSFADARTGLVLDNCQHVVLGCCTNYTDLLGRLGASGRIAWHREQYWVEPGGRVSVVRPSALPAPGHFGPSVLRARFLSLGEKLRLARGMLAVMRADRAAWRRETFAGFLAACGQGPRLIERFWEPVVVSACNLSVGRVSAAGALQVFQEGFLAHRDAATMGVPTVPLVDLYAAAPGLIARAGGSVRLGVSVVGIERDAVRITEGETARTLRAHRVISALPPERLAEVAGPGLRARDPRIARLDGVGHSPIVGVHLMYDRPVMETPHAVLVGSGTQWVFRKDDAGRALHAVISGAEAWTALDEREITRRVTADIAAYFPRAAGAALEWSRPVKERRATFRLEPGIEDIRPEVVDPRDERGLLIAGDFARSGWPATMEGATRTGYIAAAAALGLPERALLAPDLATAPLAGLLGLRQARAGATA